MNQYEPEKWVVLRLTQPDGEVWFRLLAGWYGGFASGDSWRANSGITKIVDKGELYEVYGSSGSCYYCYKTAEGLSGYMDSVLYGFQQAALEQKANVELSSVEVYLKENPSE